MYFIYVLNLEKGKWFIGKTADVLKCYQEHQAGTGSAWTAEYPPVSLVESRPVISPHDENNVTKDFMKNYGVEHVRGGSYSQVVLDESSISVLKNELASIDTKCLKCGSVGHYALQCTEQTAAERYYHNQLNRMKTYYEKNKETIAQKRREKRLEAKPEIQGRGKFNPKNTERKE